MDKYQESLQAFTALLDSMTPSQLLEVHHKYKNQNSVTLSEFFGYPHVSFELDVVFEPDLLVVHVHDVKSFFSGIDTRFFESDNEFLEAA